jgi:hypothetical protein
MRQAAALLGRLWAAVADAGFDSEAAHRLCRRTLGIRRTAIRLNPRRGRRWPRTPYRREMRRRFPRRLYRRRQQAEAVFSRLKRRLGSALAARSPARQREELVLRVLTHNLTILHCGRTPFQQSQSDPNYSAAQLPVDVYRRTPNCHTQSAAPRNTNPNTGVSANQPEPTRPSTYATGKYEMHASGTMNVRNVRNHRA